MATITRDMLNIPADMLRDEPLTISIAQLQIDFQQRQELLKPHPMNSHPICKPSNARGEGDRVSNKISKEVKQKFEAMKAEHQEHAARQLGQQELKAVLLEREEEKRNQRVNQLAGLTDRPDRFSKFLDLDFPPKVFPRSKGYEEYLKICQERTNRRNEVILNEHPEYKLVEPYVIEVDIDTRVTDGFIQQLDDHIKVWTEPCLIRLSDILKQTNEYHKRFAEFKLYEKSALPDRVACRRHYALPHTHRDEPSCGCIFCRSCFETLNILPSVGITAEILAMGMIDKIRQRTACVFVSQIKMSFQEEAEVALDERICYGFRSAIPPLVLIHFKEFFTEMYSIGADMCWEIMKRLAIVIKYTPDYTSALHFLTFWVDVCERVDRVVRRLENDMDCFNWKLKECNLSLKILFFHLIEILINELEEFQDVLKQCKRVVALQRVYHPCRENEIDNRYLLVGLARIESAISEASEGWKNKSLPFEFVEYDVPKYNVFKISRLRNPYVKMEPNTMEAYEIVQCSITGALEMRNLEHNAMQDIDVAEPIMDCDLSLPSNPNMSYHIRMFRRELCMTPAETDQFVKSSDISFLRNHGVNISVKYGGKEYMDKYVQKRDAYNLDTVEGRLSLEVEDILLAESRQAARDDFRFKRRMLNAKERERSTKAARSLKWPPTYPIYGHKTRQRSMLRSFRTILQRTFWKPKVLKYCRKGIKCERYERSFTSRYRYAFGGLPVLNRDPRSALMEGQKYDVSQEILSYALQLGTGYLDPLASDGKKTYKYYVMYTVSDFTPMDSKPKVSTKHNPELYDNLCKAIHILYTNLAQYDLITIEESLVSPHQIQQDWGHTMLEKVNSYDFKNLSNRFKALKKDNPKTTTKPRHPHCAKKTISDNIGRKCGTSPLPALVDISSSRRKVAVAAASTSHGDNEEEHLVAISEDGQILAFGTRVTPPPPEPKARTCRTTTTTTTMTKEKGGNDWKTVTSCRCPHVHGDPTKSQAVSCNGTVLVEASPGKNMGSTMCSHHHVHEAAHVHNHAHSHAHNHTHNHTNPPPATRAAPQAGGNAKPATKSEQRPSRPGLPVSVGYAEKRNDLRQKLERGKQEKKKGCLHERTLPIAPPLPTVVTNQKKKKETVVFTTTSPPTDDVGELVNFIEGTPASGANSSRKGSTCSDTVDPKKAAKKARKKERKEQMKLDEENQRLAQEALERQLEEDLRRKEEEDKEEQARKRREKKKKQKQKKKEKEADPSLAELLSCVRVGGSSAGAVGESGPKKKKDDEKKRSEDDKTKKEKDAERRISSQVATPVDNNSAKTSRNPTITTDDNPIVTIRRHSNTPDANVTISVKGDNGEEDVLYTLVNGKVLRADAVASTKEVTSNPTSGEVSKKKKKKAKGTESGGNSLLNTTIAEDTTSNKIKENGVVVLESTKTYIEDKVVQQRTVNSFLKQNQTQASSRKPGIDNSSSRGEEIDVDNLNIPSGLTITRLSQPLSSYSHHSTTESKSWEGISLTKIGNPNQGYTNVSHGSDGYGNQQNIFLGNQNFSMGEDCPTFGQQPIIFQGKEPGPGEFEEVVSNKKRRLRNKANKLKDGEEEPEAYPSQPRDSNGSLEFKMMDLSLNSSTVNNQYQPQHSKRNPEEGVSASAPPNTSTEIGRRKRLVQKSDGRGGQGTSQRNVNGLSPKGNSNRNTPQSKESGGNAEYQPTLETHNSQRGKMVRVPGTLGGGTMPRLNRQIQNNQSQTQTQTRSWFNSANNSAPLQEDMSQKPGILGNSWGQVPQQNIQISTEQQATLFDSSVRRLNDMGYVQSQTQPGHFEKNEQAAQLNGGWHPLNSFNTDCRQLSFQQPELNHYQSNMVPQFHSGEAMFGNFQKMQPGPQHQQQHPQHQQQHPFQFMGPSPNVYQQNLQFAPDNSHDSIFGDYNKLHNQNYNESPSFNNSVDSSAYHRMNSDSPFNSRVEPQTQTTFNQRIDHQAQQTFNPRIDPQTQQPFTGVPWRKQSQSAPGDTFASVLKRIENESKEQAFGFGPFMQAERTSGSPWTWGGESDRSESGSGGARPSPEVFYQNNAVGSGGQVHYVDDNNASSRAQSCDSALVGGSVPLGIGSPYSNVIQTPIRRPTPTSPFLFGNSPVEQPQTGMNVPGSPGPSVPEWDSSMKLGTFWSSHKTPR